MNQNQFYGSQEAVGRRKENDCRKRVQELDELINDEKRKS